MTRCIKQIFSLVQAHHWYSLDSKEQVHKGKILDRDCQIFLVVKTDLCTIFEEDSLIFLSQSLVRSLNCKEALQINFNECNKHDHLLKASAMKQYNQTQVFKKLGGHNSKGTIHTITKDSMYFKQVLSNYWKRFYFHINLFNYYMYLRCESCLFF